MYKLKNFAWSSACLIFKAVAMLDRFAIITLEIFTLFIHFRRRQPDSYCESEWTAKVARSSQSI